MLDSPGQMSCAGWTAMDPSDCNQCRVRSIALFGEVDQEAVEQLHEHVQQIEQPMGSRLFEEGEPAEAGFTLREGVIKLVRHPAGGRPQIVRLLVGGDFFGAEGLFGEPHRHTAIALTPIRLCRFPNAMLEALRSQDPGFTYALLGRWRRALDEVESLAVELGTLRAEERVASFLLHWQSKHGGQADWLPLPLSRTELGELLGLRVETVSRVMARWKREGVFEERGGCIRLLATEGLRADLQMPEV